MPAVASTTARSRISTRRRISTRNYAIAIYNRGNAYFAKGDADRAIQNYDRALTLNPKYQDALVNRGVAYEKKAAYDRAIADYNEALKLDAKDAMA